MKNSWQTKKLGEVCDFQNGFAFKSSEYVDSGFFVMRIGNVQDGYISLSDPKYIQKSYKPFEKFILESGDILISLTGNVGRVGVINDEHLPAVINQRVARINLKNKYNIEKQFLLYFLSSSYFIKELINAGHGAAQQNISTKDVEDLEIPIPPIIEQQRIVKILDEISDNIAKAKENAEKNLANSKELFESYLQSIDARKESLGKMVDIRTGKLDANAATENGQYPFFTCSREVFAIDKFAFDCEAILLAGNNAVGDFNVKHYNGKFNAYQRTYVITVNKENKVLYRYLYFQLLNSLKEFKSKSVGTGTKFLKLGMIKDLMIPLPSYDEQESIVAKLDALSTETKKLESIYKQKIADLEELKKSVLKKAFSGEL